MTSTSFHRCVVVTVSDSVAQGTRQDVSGEKAREKLRALGFEVAESRVMGDDQEQIAALLRRLADEERIDLVVTTGGTGLGPRDVTPEATTAVIEKAIPGLRNGCARSRAAKPASLSCRGRWSVSEKKR